MIFAVFLIAGVANPSPDPDPYAGLADDELSPLR